MARQADVRRVALSLPETVEAPNHFAFSVRNKGKLKGFKDFLLALDPARFFTEPHYNGFPAVLIRLPDGLPLHVAGSVRPATRERHSVVHDVPRPPVRVPRLAHKPVPGALAALAPDVGAACGAR